MFAGISDVAITTIPRDRTAFQRVPGGGDGTP